MPANATPTRAPWSAFLYLFVATAIVACGRGKEQRAPDSPVGRFEIVSGSFTADGKGSLNFVRERRTTVEVRADHTLRYEWKNLIESGASEGSLEATWREPTAGERQRDKWPTPSAVWIVFGKGEPDRVRDLTDVSGVILWWARNQWLIPVVDQATGKFTGASWIVQHVDE